jgi:hypothetical protein
MTIDASGNGCISAQLRRRRYSTLIAVNSSARCRADILFERSGFRSLGTQ